MSWWRANASARARSRLAIATTATRDDALAPTMNDPAIFAAPRIPIRRLIAREATRASTPSTNEEVGSSEGVHRSASIASQHQIDLTRPRCSGRTPPLDELAPI